jgi:diguanylate cyclase (GGDEF)-like protein
VLAQLSPRLLAAAGGGAMLARLGGDEFAVVLEGSDVTESVRHAQLLLEALAEPLQVEWLTLHVAASIGIACYPQHGRSGDDLLRHADVALYYAKGSDDPSSAASVPMGSSRWRSRRG